MLRPQRAKLLEDINSGKATNAALPAEIPAHIPTRVPPNPYNLGFSENFKEVWSAVVNRTSHSPNVVVAVCALRGVVMALGVSCPSGGVSVSLACVVS